MFAAFVKSHSTPQAQGTVAAAQGGTQCSQLANVEVPQAEVEVPHDECAKESPGNGHGM